MRKSGKAVGRANLKKALAQLKADLPKVVKRNKFKAVRTTRHGIAFHSKGEADRYDELLLLVKAGEIVNIGLQPRFPLYVSDEWITDYIGDFIYTREGQIIVEDFKGHRTPEYRLKKKLFEALLAPLKITETCRASRRLTRRNRRTK